MTTFRGTDYRDGGAYGTIPENPTSLSIVWSQRIGGLDDWSGVGWTGQASLVRWTAAQRQMMNIVPEKQSKDGLIEGIYATLDGHIYFFDLEDGVPTRNPINIGAPIKGSVSVDPRGLPLLYCGQGIYDVGGKRVKCGTRIWSLIDQSLLYMIDGSDSVVTPIIKLSTTPSLAPFASRASAMGIQPNMSAYIGIPQIVAIITPNGLPVPSTFIIHFSGIQLWINAPIPTPTST